MNSSFGFRCLVTWVDYVGVVGWCCVLADIAPPLPDAPGGGAVGAPGGDAGGGWSFGGQTARLSVLARAEIRRRNNEKQNIFFLLSLSIYLSKNLPTLHI